MTRRKRAPAVVEPEPEPAAELPRVARLWPELAGVPWDRVVRRAVDEAPLYDPAA
ncbi:MAG: hypothetical protein ACRDWI_07840 [Jiangellaceae bacterium]